MGCLLVLLESWRDLTGVSCYGCAVALWLSVQLCSSDDSVRFLCYSQLDQIGCTHGMV